MGDILEISALASHRNQLCKGISRLLDSEVGCDFEISCADSTPIKAHFFVLQIFCRALQNSKCRRIRFASSEIQRKDVRCLLEFIYCGKTRIEMERMDAVKRAAVKLGLEAVLDLVEGIQVKNVENEEVENETDAEIKAEACESFSEDKDDYTEYSEMAKELKSNVGKHDENCDIGKHLASKKYGLRSYQGGNLNPQLPTKHQTDSNDQVLEKSVKCDQCEFTCAAEVLFKTHIKSAHCANDKDESKRHNSNARDPVCETCGRCLKTATILRRHKLKHLEKVNCEVCGGKYSLTSIGSHRMLHEIGGKAKKFKCTICAYRTRWRSSLKKHLKRIHDMSEGEIARLVHSEATRISDEIPQGDLGKERRSFKGKEKRPTKH